MAMDTPLSQRLAARRWQLAQLADGRCRDCGDLVTTVNASTGKLFTRCPQCRADASLKQGVRNAAKRRNAIARAA